MRRGQKGFTLIELLVVIAILGILAAVAIPRVLGAIDNGRRSANATNAAVIQSALARYEIDNPTLPLSQTASLEGSLGTGAPAFRTYLQGGVLPGINSVLMDRGVGTMQIPASGTEWRLGPNGGVFIWWADGTWAPSTP